VIIEELASVEGGKLYCVDTWKGSPNVAQHQDVLARYDVFGTFLHNVKQAGGGAFVHPLMMSANDAAPIIADGCMDLVFIDGDHSYSSTSTDILLWKPKVRVNGILCGHDCECRPIGTLRDAVYSSLSVDSISGQGTQFAVIHPGVVAAVDEAFNGAANLWAESPFLRIDGTIGRATLWDNRVSARRLGRQLSLSNVQTETIPRLVGSKSGYNIVSFDGVHYAVPQSLGPMDLSQLNMSAMPAGMLAGRSYDDALRAIAEAVKA
jgi:hypothetical protein